MSQPIKKSAPNERIWPYKKFRIDDWRISNHVEIQFNCNQQEFDYDLIRISVGGREALISRDDIAQVLIVGYDERKKYEEAMNLEAKQLKNIDLDRL